MNTQVTAALISGGVALVVALLGIAGAIAAQSVATRRAFANSLVLLERQFAQSLAATEQERTDKERERQELIRREDAYRYSEQRRSTYARFLRLAAALQRANTAIGFVRRGGLGSDKPGEPGNDLYQRRLDRWVERADEFYEQLSDVAAEIEVIASTDVHEAVAKMLNAIGVYAASVQQAGADPDDNRGYLSARGDFLLAARRELGVGQSLQ